MTAEQGLDEAALAEVREKAFALTLPGPTAEFYADLAEAAVRRYIGLTTLPASKGRDELREAVARLAALAGLGTINGEPREPTGKWKQDEWEKRILECVPSLVQQQCYDLADAILALTSGATGGFNPTHRHVNRGTDYEVIGHAELQSACPVDPTEGDELVIYRGEDGKLWARVDHEFNDGRFKPLPAPTNGSDR
jgi:hypothetical protein